MYFRTNSRLSFKVGTILSALLFIFTPDLPLTADELDTRLAELVRQISASLTEENKAKIAVIEFSDLNGKVTEFGKFLSEELITRLFMTKKFEVVERQLLVKVLEEHKLNMTGVVDPTSAKELGKILGVDAIASGTITDLGTSVKLNARLIATETGKIFAVASVEIVKDEKIRKLMVSLPDEGKEETPKEKPTKSHGLKVEYFNLRPFELSPPPFGEPVTVGIDELVDYSWGNRSPANNVSNDFWGARWTGFLFAPVSGSYSFATPHQEMDGVRLFIDGKSIYDFWTFRDRSQRFERLGEMSNPLLGSPWKTTFLEGNKWYAIKLEFYNIDGNSAISLKWIPPGESDFQLIPFRYLKPE